VRVFLFLLPLNIISGSNAETQSRLRPTAHNGFFIGGKRPQFTGEFFGLERPVASSAVWRGFNSVPKLDTAAMPLANQKIENVAPVPSRNLLTVPENCSLNFTHKRNISRNQQCRRPIRIRTAISPMFCVMASARPGLLFCKSSACRHYAQKPAVNQNAEAAWLKNVAASFAAHPPAKNLIYSITLPKI